VRVGGRVRVAVRILLSELVRGMERDVVRVSFDEKDKDDDRWEFDRLSVRDSFTVSEADSVR